MTISRRSIAFCTFSACLLAPRAWAASTKASYMHYLKALLDTNQGNYPEALREYESALDLDPQSAFMYQQAAELALETGQMDKALALAQRFARISPRDHGAFYLLGNVRWARGEGKEAQAAFEKSLELKPGFKDALFALGNLLSAQSPEAAKKYLQDYLKQNPDNAADAEYQLALIEQKAGNNDRAIAHLKAAARSDPDNLQVLYGLAQVYEIAQDTDSALGVYRGILEHDTNNVALVNHIGELLAQEGDATRAREQFLRAKSIQNDNPMACLWLALLAEHDGDFDSATAYLKQSSELKQDPGLNLRLSYYLTQANRLKEAVDVLERAHEKWSNNEGVLYFLALGYDDMKMTPKAISLMQQVLKLRPDHRDARFQLGTLYEKSGDIKNTEVQFREILKSHPQDAAALNYLGYSLTDRGMKLDEAEGFIRRAVSLEPNNGAYLDSLGWVHFKQGRYEEARAELEAARKLLNDDETLWDHLGEVYGVLGDTGAAWTSWQMSEAVAPGNGEVPAKLRRIERLFSPQELGVRYLELIERQRGKLASYGGPCLIEGRMGGKEFRFQAIVSYKASGDFTIEVLGPMFAPLLRIALQGREGFEMDPLHLEGVDPQILRDRLYGALRLVRDYLDGSLFDERPARFHKSWRRRRVRTPRFTLFLDKADSRLRSIQSLADGSYKLSLGDYRAASGHWLPTGWSVQGRGFSLNFHFPNPGSRFE